MDELSATGSNGLGVDKVIGGAISSFIKRIVLPSGVARHIEAGTKRGKGWRGEGAEEPTK